MTPDEFRRLKRINEKVLDFECEEEHNETRTWDDPEDSSEEWS